MTLGLYVQYDASIHAGIPVSFLESVNVIFHVASAN